MIFALKNGVRVEASPKDKALCPICNGIVISKCGEVKIWHWSHISNKDCDSWVEPESEWHLSWKLQYPKEQQEIIISKCISDYCNNPKYNHNHKNNNHENCPDCEYKKHRADVKTKEGTVIEFQNSPISSEEIKEREEFYGDMIWVLNGKIFASGLCLRNKKDYLSFRWKHPPQSFFEAKKPIFIHLDGQHGDGFYGNGWIFHIKKIHTSIPCGGWGLLIKKDDFLKYYV